MRVAFDTAAIGCGATVRPATSSTSLLRIPLLTFSRSLIGITNDRVPR